MSNVDRIPSFAATAAAGLAPPLAPLRAQMHAIHARERRAARRKMIGSCECGEVAGEAWCPYCDGGLPRPPLPAREQMALAKLVAEAPKVLQPHTPHKPNRHERRRAMSRRWRR
jgi:hypothetical protein